MQDVARIQKVHVTSPTTLAVTWGDDSVSPVDLAGWITRGGRPFAALGNALVFAGASVGLYGGNVTWDDDEGDLAIDSEHLRMLAGHQAPFDVAAAARWQEDMRVSNAEAADLLGLAQSTWAAYKAGTTIPSTVARLCRAMRDEPTMLSAHLRREPPATQAGDRSTSTSARVLTSAGPNLAESQRCAGLCNRPFGEFYQLPEEYQVRASVVLRGDGMPVVYKGRRDPPFPSHGGG